MSDSIATKKKPRLVISAAHTSSAPGSIYQDLREFDLTRKILDKTIPYLTKDQIEHKVVPVDLPLLQRIDWINETGYKEEDGDLFLEIHVNDGGKKGIEGWYRDEDEEGNNSKKFAEFFIDEFCKVSKYESQGAKSEYDHDLGSLLILNQTNPIAIAVEFLYIDNPEEYKILKDDAKLDEIAKNISATIKKYIDNPPALSAPKKKDDPFGLDDMDNGDSMFGPSVGKDPFGFDTSSSVPATSGSGVTMDREERKTMINDMYQKLLGTEPKQSDLNYYLNIGVTKEQLIQRITESKEHEQMVTDAKSLAKIQKQQQTQEGDLIKAQNRVKDLEVMYNTLQELLKHKTNQIKQMQDELIMRGIIKPGEYFDPNRVQRPVA